MSLIHTLNKKQHQEMIILIKEKKLWPKPMETYFDAYLRYKSIGKQKKLNEMEDED